MQELYTSDACHFRPQAHQMFRVFMTSITSAAFFTAFLHVQLFPTRTRWLRFPTCLYNQRSKALKFEGTLHWRFKLPSYRDES